MRGEDMQAFFTPLYVCIECNSLRGFCQQQSLTKGNSKERTLANRKWSQMDKHWEGKFEQTLYKKKNKCN